MTKDPKPMTQEEIARILKRSAKGAAELHRNIKHIFVMPACTIRLR